MSFAPYGKHPEEFVPAKLECNWHNRDAGCIHFVFSAL